MDKFTKLSALVGDTFTVEKAYGFLWKRWDNEAKKMLTSDNYEQGFKKVYSVDTDKGKLDLGGGQLGNLLEATYKEGRSDIIGKTFEVKSNGKSGMDIRYYINLAKEQKPVQTKQDEVYPVDDAPIDLGDIPF